MESSPTESQSSPRRKHGRLGTGLPIWALLLLFGIALGLFLFWGGPLWTADREQSHAARLGWSYLLVIPVAALFLAINRSFTFTNLGITTVVVWSMKLVTTVPLYFAISPGTSNKYEPAEPWESSITQPGTQETQKETNALTEYQPACRWGGTAASRRL